ncbi:MAG: hypothetical protein A3J83_07850 [Elusimicrobia bacterium RIFOXYA2_FULL_40_6]|nr:MAG: hypothetical protein A3J83_07850 [Elusimicrobia bacterium RIFOXYA2_FULL_40_6]
MKKNIDALTLDVITNVRAKENIVNDKTDRDGLSQVFLSGGLHDIELEKIIDFLLDLLSNLKDQKHEMIIGRINAVKNQDYIEYLNNKDICLWTKIMEYKPRKIPILQHLKNKFIDLLSPQYKQPWAFCKINDLNKLKDVLIKYWFCYGGNWIFLIGGEQFNEERWNNARIGIESFTNIWNTIKIVSNEIFCSVVISDDYQIEIFFHNSNYDFTMNTIKTLLKKYNIEIAEERIIPAEINSFSNSG